MDRLEDKTKEMIGVMTGGDSICYLTGNMGTQSFPNQLDPVWVVHHGRYPLYGVHIRICDVDKLNALISNRTMWDEVVAQSEQHATVEVLVPGHATDLHVVLPFRYRTPFTLKPGRMPQSPCSVLKTNCY